MTAPADQARPPRLEADRISRLWLKAARAAALLTSLKLTVATAESLTGGWLSAALTSVPGSSAYFLAGLTAYSNAAKVRLLGVSERTLAERGAVSPECSLEMAAGVLLAAGASLGLSTTGIAGPDGGSPEKPVGLVYVSVTDGTRGLSTRFDFSGDRSAVTLEAADMALTMLINRLVRSDFGAPILV
jgi:nicotinamide-nucleotide amidase